MGDKAVHLGSASPQALKPENRGMVTVTSQAKEDCAPGSSRHAVLSEPPGSWNRSLPPGQ